MRDSSMLTTKKSATTARYFSSHKPPKDFSKNEFPKIVGLPKVGVPTALVELSYPSEEWIIKKKKKNVIRIIFPQGCQMTYKIAGEKMARFTNTDKQIEIPDQVSYFKAAPPKKKAEWIFVFRNPHDLHTFIQIVENVTNPEIPISKDPPITSIPRSDSLERRNKDYVKRLGLDKDDEIKREKDPEAEATANETALETADKTAIQIQKIKDKVFSQKL